MSKETKQAMKRFNKMLKRHRKQLHKLVRKDAPYDYCFLHELVVAKICQMYEYYLAGDNVWQSNESRERIADQLEDAVKIVNAIDRVHTENLSYEEKLEKEIELYKKLYTHIGEYILEWWD